MRKFVVILTLCVILLTSCSDRNVYFSDTYFAMNTVVQIVTDEENVAPSLYKKICDYENMFSRTLPESEIYKLNENGTAVLSDEALYVLQKSLEIAKDTNLAFNPCMGTLTELWNITSGEEKIPGMEEIERAKSFCNPSNVRIDGNTVTLPQGMKLDLGGVAKGYALQKALFSKEEGNLCISLGGNVGVIGNSESRAGEKIAGWTVGITNPFDKQTTVGELVLCEKMVAVSGAYERYFEKDGKVYHHIFDTFSGYPAESDLASAAVIFSDGLEADALSTALFVMGKDESVEFYQSGKYDFDMILITNDGELLVSEGIYDDFSPNTSEYLKGKKIKITKK